MAEATPEIERILEQARAAMIQMRRDGLVGEIAIVVGGNQYQVEERPRRRHVPVKLTDRGSSVVEVVGSA